MQRSRYTHIAKQVFPYSQESTTGSLPHLPLAVEQLFTIGKGSNISYSPYLSLVEKTSTYHTYQQAPEQISEDYQREY